jgi:TM2 domain-containing membrane protein YozV
VDPAAEICPKCGVRIKDPPQTHVPSRKNPGFAAVLSFVFMGAGQIYNGQIRKGIFFAVLGVILLTIYIFVPEVTILVFFFSIYNIYDAYNTAKKINVGIVRTD